MNRATFKTLVDTFSTDISVEEKVDFLLKHDLKSLSNPQIEKLLNTLDIENTKKLINTISNKIKQIK